MRADLYPLCSFGHVASYSELLQAFRGQESAVLPFRTGGGRTRHLRSGVYICAHLSEPELTAAWCGGHLDCVTVLEERGIPVPAHARAEIHLRLARGSSRAAERRHAYAPMSHVHWSRLRTPLPSLGITSHAAMSGNPIDRLRVPFREALRQALTTCLSYEQGAAALAAIAGDGAHDVRDAAHAIAVAPRRVEMALREMDAVPAEVDVALVRLRSGHRL